MFIALEAVRRYRGLTDFAVGTSAHPSGKTFERQATCIFDVHVIQALIDDYLRRYQLVPVSIDLEWVSRMILTGVK